jgi:formylglycine-generating enzyme required for sulfatase activity
MEFVRIPAGEIQVFQPVGTDGNESNVLQSVKIAKPFWMARTEVTVAQFRKFVKATGHVTEAERAGARWNWKNPGFPQTGRHPVVFLGHADALRYCDWAGVRLPTQTEWLYACKAGTTNRYYWGDRLDDRFAWHRLNTRATGTRPVARKLPNPWGLHDMVGNAREYTGIGEGCYRALGSSWTRCDAYLTRQGTMATDLLAEGLDLRLESPVQHRRFPPYPFDDDRGFRCVRQD